MRLVALTALVMVAFAANSILNRLALVGSGTGPAAFALLRLVSGAVVLVTLARLRNGPVRLAGRSRIGGAASLAVYVLGFSFAYVTLNAGVGALILFGGVQITMFAGAVLARERMPAARWIGAAIAFAGLAYLLWPGAASAPDLAGALLMAAAAVGWGIYSLLGRGGKDPLGDTAANFAWAVPAGLVVFLVFQDGMSTKGAVLAIVSGGLTSGAGYALWYAVLPRIEASIAAVAQLTVPVIALAGGIVFLGEPITWRFVIATALVLGGIAISLRRPKPAPATGAAS